VPALRFTSILAELRGYHYHTGVVFSAYAPGQGQAVAQGGRYDEIGQVIRPGPAGHRFQHRSGDLLLLVRRRMRLVQVFTRQRSRISR